MNTRIAVTALAIALTVFAAGAVRADETRRQITVSGQGRVATVPDMGLITLGVTNQAREAGAAMAATSDATARMLARLGDMGIAARDVQTGSLSLNPVWSDGDSPTGNARITGFVARNSVRVRVRDLSALGGIMDAVIADGANDFNGLQLSVQEPEPLMNQAREAAVADAMAKAALLAGAAGMRLGKVLSMTEQGGGRPVVMEMAAARAGPVPISAGEVTVSASVLMVFAIGD